MRKSISFYKSVFGGEFTTMSRFKDMPEDPNFPLSEADMEKVMHVSLPIGRETVLMGSDTGGEWSAHFRQGNNFPCLLMPIAKRTQTDFLMPCP